MCVRVYITLWAVLPFVSFVSPLSIRFVRPFFTPCHFSWNKKNPGRPERNAWHSPLVSFFLICTCAHSHNTHVYIYTDTHIAITLDRSYSMGILLLLSAPAGWLDSFWFSLLWFHQLLVCTYYQQSGFCPFVVFYSIFVLLFPEKFRLLFSHGPNKWPAFPESHSDVCVWELLGTSTLFPTNARPPHYTISAGFVRNRNKLRRENHLKTPWLGICCCCCVRLLLCEKNKIK